MLTEMQLKEKAHRQVEMHGCLLLNKPPGSLRKVQATIMCVCLRVIERTPREFAGRPFCDRCRKVPASEIKSFIRRCRRWLGKVRKGDAKHSYECIGWGRPEMEAMFAALPGNPSIRSRKWTMDHVRPLAVLARLGLRDLKIANALDNVLPMTVEENTGKGARCDPREVVAWLRSKGFYPEVACA